MSFTSYKPFKKRNLFPKYMIVFLLGIFSVVLFTRAINIVTNIDNATQYIKQIIVTSDGTSAGSQAVVIDSAATNKLIVNGKTRFYSGLRIDGDLDIVGNIAGNSSQVTFNTGIFTNISSDNYCDKDGTTCKTIADIGGSSYWNNGLRPGVIYYNSGDVGIGTDTPSQALEVSGNVVVSGTGTFKLLEAGTLGGFGVSNTAGLFGGRVGINTLSPQSALDIFGNLNVNGLSYFSGTSYFTGGDLNVNGWSYFNGTSYFTGGDLNVNGKTYLNGKVGINITESVEYQPDLEVSNVFRITPLTLGNNDCSLTGIIVYETSQNSLCFCNGSVFKLVADGTTNCTSASGGGGIENES